LTSRCDAIVILADLLRVEDLVPLAVFGTFAALAWWVLDWLAAAKPRAVERLDELKRPRSRFDPHGLPLKKTDTMSKVLEKATPALARPLEPKSEAELSRLKLKLATAGFRGESASKAFLGLKFTGLLVGLALGAGVFMPLWGTTQRTLVTAVALTGAIFYLPDIALWWIGRSRQQAIFLGLPDALDLLVVCVEAGLGLDQAMRKVAEESKKTCPTLAGEFSLANFQLQMGRPRSEVLHELGVRTGVADLRNLAAVLIQAEKFGSSVALALRTQSDAMRVRRRQIAEEKAAKTAVKLIFPLVLFIFPGIFVVLVGPAAITMVRDMFPVMSGGK
jgi:tight adherence protein C